MMKVKKKNGTALDCSFLLAALPALTATKQANSLFEALKVLLLMRRLLGLHLIRAATFR